MNRKELVDAIAEVDSNLNEDLLTKKDIDKVVGLFTQVVREAVSSGEKVTLVGFGSFERRFRKEREGRNPKTGEKMVIAAHYAPSFSPGLYFKQDVEGTNAD